VAKILVVDDRALCREFLVTLLSFAQHQVFEAADGLEALKIIKKENPELIITDLLMPTMNGYELVQHIKSDLAMANIPIIFYTASYLIEEAKLLAETCGVKHVIYKPSKPELIIEVVNDAIGGVPVKDSAVEKVILTHEVTQNNNDIIKLGEQLKMYVDEMEKVKKTIDVIIDNTTEQPAEHHKLIKFSELFSDDLKKVDTLSHQLVALSELTLNAVMLHHPKNILLLFVENGRHILGCQYGAVGIFNSDKAEFKYLMTTGMSDSDNPKMVPFKKDHSLVKKIIDNKGLLVLDNSKEKIELPDHHPDVKYILGAKLSTASHLYGFIYFSDKLDGSAFTEDDIKIFGALELNLSHLYENAEMYDAIQRHAVKLQLTINDIANE
jgi:CheY-like chemotaxis protein